MKTFVIGDVHGHFDRLEALLLNEGIIGRCPDCDGAGLLPRFDGPREHDCETCSGDGWTRIDRDVFVVQLGDLGHFGDNGSPTGDMLCWRAAYLGWIDVVLWGNHDRAVVDTGHCFKHFTAPDAATLHYIKAMYNEGRLQLAFESHGYLLTHAGLHKAFKHQKIDPELKTDLVKFVDWINEEDDKFLDTSDCDASAFAIRDCISHKRGGRADAGGILWRDSRESLYGVWPQVFGHTKNYRVREYNANAWCIDIGSPDNGELAGMWLPGREVVQINTNMRRNGKAHAERIQY